MKVRVGVVCAVLIAASMGLSADLAQAIPTGNNGNQGGNNGNHYGWYKENGNGNGGQYNSQAIQLTTTQNGTTQNGTSVPEPASLALLGAGLAGMGIWRRMSKKV